MNGIGMGVFLIGGIIVGVTLAAKCGHRMPLVACITSMLLGVLLVALPTLGSLLLKLTGHDGRLSENESIPCWILGGILALVGLVSSFFSSRGAAPAPKD